ncbi:chemotaxis protein CheB [Variovorax dokdonensis]|uniref:protein-glutamate methylesterase n=1 Tax=Variovorax dokdonensis TaxID=344883 RepID=A0ABT7N5Q8_9BURK|nr:chemotaxis protein CheB [Variovorax dokdonensis]MDM0043286.1 chemotaxis protein CheB [Variovorax dokdonensis]
MNAVLNARMRDIELVAIGASAGGVDALLTLLQDLPSPWRLPVVVVLHLPEGHESRLPALFAERTRVAVHEAHDKLPIEAASLYFAPSGYHLSVERDRCFSLSCEPPVLFSRPSIDLLMISAADAYGPALAGIVLTGANEDGARGLLSIRNAGGLTAVQDPDTALSPTMPQAALALHEPDVVRPLSGLREFLVQMDQAHAQ